MATTSTEHGETTFPPFDPEYFASQIFWLAVIFGGMYLVLSRLVLPRLADVIERRRDRIASDLDRAAQLNAAAQQVGAEKARKIADAQERAGVLTSGARAEIAVEIATELEAYDAEEKEHLAKARARIAEAERNAANELTDSTRQMTMLILAKVSRVDIDDTIVDQAIAVADGGRV